MENFIGNLKCKHYDAILLFPIMLAKDVSRDSEFRSCRLRGSEHVWYI